MEINRFNYNLGYLKKVEKIHKSNNGKSPFKKDENEKNKKQTEQSRGKSDGELDITL